MSMVKFPYGISNFEMLVKEGYFFVDKTRYIKLLEDLGIRYAFMLRPRRFGKSLWISILHYYYGVEYKDKFDELFGRFFIGKHPTPMRNSYLVLRFNFSGIDTTTWDTTFEGFTENIRAAVSRFNITYGLLSESEQSFVNQADAHNVILLRFFNMMGKKLENRKILILIDEYDHFANEVLAFRIHEFQEMVARTGYVRKFYEVIKDATGLGIVDRMFVTGVTPITLDSITSGFNIAEKLNDWTEFNEMMGFTADEVETVIKILCDKCGCRRESIADTLERYYNGYKFTPDATVRLYNPNMVFHFAKHFLSRCKPPFDLIDVNIVSDYSKVWNYVRIGRNQGKTLEIIERIVSEKRIYGELVPQFVPRSYFTEDEFINLLFYLGVLTIEGTEFGQIAFAPPNYVVETIYLNYFKQQLEETYGVEVKLFDLRRSLQVLAYQGDITPFVKQVENVLRQLSRREFRKFNEKYIKAIMAAYLLLTPVYFVKTEYEVNGGYIDLVLFRRPPFDAKYQYVFEFKYVPKGQASPEIVEEKRREAIQQLRNYLKVEEIKAKDNLKAFVFVVVGDRFEVVQELETNS